jgi:hypothetical protein
MSEMVKIWLAEMVHREIEQVNGTISNNCLWLHSSESSEEAEMFTSNIASLEEYKTVLLQMQKKIEEGNFTV